MSDESDLLFKALADPTRRSILDLLREGKRTTSEIVEQFPELSRFGVMKHLDVLRQADLVITVARGRIRENSLNATPIQQIARRWITRFDSFWADQLLDIKQASEADSSDAGPAS